MDNKKVAIIIATIIALILLVAFLYPKDRVKGGLRGEIGPYQSAYREEYRCFGIERNFCPPWPDYGCDALCYGLVYGKKCYTETYIVGKGIQKAEANCR